MKISMIGALSIATAATALPLAGIANADASILFQTPSKNIACTGYVAPDGKPGVVCEIEHYTWLIPRPADYQMGGGATDSSSFRAARRSPVNGTQISAALRANRRSITAKPSRPARSPATASYRE